MTTLAVVGLMLLLVAVVAIWLVAVAATLTPIVLHLIAYLHGRRKP